MRPEPVAAAVFDTPARTERLQLLAYLLRNAAQPVYLRGPSGSGKTSAAALVAQAMDDVAGVVWLNAEQAGDLRSVFAGELARHGLPAEPWPQVLDDGGEGQDWLVVIDDVDRLDPVAAQELARLPLSRVRLLLLGEGGLDDAIPGPVQFLDLPPFNRDQAAQFLRAQAGAQAGRVTDDLVAGLHRATDGQPGALLAALDEVLRHERPVIGGPPPGRLRRHLALGGGAVLALALATVLLFQDTINDWLLGEPPAPRVTVTEPPAEIRREGGSAMSPAPPPKASQPAPSAAAPDAAPGRAESAGQQAGPAAADAEVDPLDAVLRDALAALEAKPPQQAPAAAATASPPAPAAPAATPAQPPGDGQGVAGAAGGDAKSAQGGQSRPPAAEPPRPPPAQAQQPTLSAASEDAVSPAAQAAAVDAPATGRPAARGSASNGPEPPPRQGAEVVDRSRRPAQEPAAAEPPSQGARSAAGKTPAAPAAVVEAGSGAPAGNWLDSRSPQRYTLQLVGARDRDAVERFVARYGIKAPYAIFERRLDGRPWYALVAGDYPDRAAALRARESLPAGVRAADVWPRTFASIRELQRAP